MEFSFPDIEWEALERLVWCCSASYCMINNMQSTYRTTITLCSYKTTVSCSSSPVSIICLSLHVIICIPSSKIHFHEQLSFLCLHVELKAIVSFSVLKRVQPQLRLAPQRMFIWYWRTSSDFPFVSFSLISMITYTPPPALSREFWLEYCDYQQHKIIGYIVAKFLTIRQSLGAIIIQSLKLEITRGRFAQFFPVILQPESQMTPAGSNWVRSVMGTSESALTACFIVLSTWDSYRDGIMV